MTTKSLNYNYKDFTEKNYKKLLKLAKKNYTFTFFDSKKNPPYVLWRHDVDISVHRALRLAEIENELVISSTFFLYIHSQFYNLFEKEIYEKIKKIIKLGHKIGLHFELGFYRKIRTKKEIEKMLTYEKKILEDLFHVDVNVFSFHNPNVGNSLKFDNEKISGMFNTYGKIIMKNHFYCSDSNGYWRFIRLEEVLKKHNKLKLHVLTHPEWWQKKSMSPRKRILRSVDYRSIRTKEYYDKTLRQLGRKNIS